MERNTESLNMPGTPPPGVVEARKEIEAVLDNAPAGWGVLKIFFDETSGEFFRFGGLGMSLFEERLTITVDSFFELWKVYHELFLGLKPGGYEAPLPGEFERLRAGWAVLFDFFFGQVGGFFIEGEAVDLLFNVGPVMGQDYRFDGGLLFSLQYAFLPFKRMPWYVLPVYAQPLPVFARQLAGIFRPVYEKTAVLIGFDKFYSPDALEAMTERERQAAIMRKERYEIMLAAARASGAVTCNLNKKQDLYQWLQKGREGWLILLTTHFENSPGEPRLFIQSGSIRMENLLADLGKIQRAGNLRADIILDALTCNNFGEFKELYNLGFLYIYMTPRPLNTDLIAFSLWEIFTGCNGSGHPDYLLGELLLHQVKAETWRNFFTKWIRHQPVQIPIKNMLCK